MLLVAVCTMVQVWTAEKQHFFCCFWKTMEKINYFFPLFLKNSKRILLPVTPAASYIRPIRNDSKTLKMIKTLAHGYSSVRAIQWIPTWHGLDGFRKSLRPCALDESSLSIGRVNISAFEEHTWPFDTKRNSWDWYSKTFCCWNQL